MIRDLIEYLEDIETKRMMRREMARLKVEILKDATSTGRNIIAAIFGKLDDPTPAETRMPSPGEIRAESDRREREDYVPAEPSRLDLGDGRIMYQAVSREIVRPGDTCSIAIGVHSPVPGEFNKGRPGLPETRMTCFGPAEDFKPLEIMLSDDFALAGAFFGSKSAFPRASQYAIPNEYLKHGKPQIDYPETPMGIPITLTVKNTSNRQRPCQAKVVGTPCIKETK